MTSRSAASTITALVIISCISGVVLANDAGSGGDVGNSTSTAHSLSAVNATYYGNLTNLADENDYYSISMPNNTGIYAELISPGFNGSNGTGFSSSCYNATSPPCDFDMFLYSSTGSTIDSSLSTSGFDDVTSNGTNVGGTTVYVNVDQWDGDGQYALIINIFSTSTGGGGGGGGNNSTSLHDAGMGYDAGNTYSTAMNLSAVNQSLWGDVDYSTDTYDYYRITVPAQHGFALTLDWNGTSTNPDLDLELYDANGSRVAYSWFGKPESLGPYNGSGGVTYNVAVVAYFGSSGDYLLNLSFDNLSSSPIYNQNDAGTGDDASDDYNNPTPINTSIGQNVFDGWASDSGDALDEYSTAVPANHGISAILTFDDSSTNLDLALAGLPNPTNNIIDTSSTFYSPESVTSNGTYVGDGSVLIEVNAISGQGDYYLSIWIFHLDSDGDGHWDDNETACLSDPDDPASVPTDTDGDGECDVLDDDDDGDGYDDANDSFPLDSSEWQDTDGDQIGDNSDEDDDGDGWTDSDEYQCGTDPLEFTSRPVDTDGDGQCDIVDDDDDDDGYLDISDAFPLDDDEWADTDGDEIGNNADLDDDDDGFPDSIEATCGSDSLDAQSIPADLDQDGSCNAVDGDDDNDGYADISDAFPLNPNEWLDTDGDNIGNNADQDDDGDSVFDATDAFPLDSSEWGDNDGDNIGDNADLDDDNDGWSDLDEEDCQTDPFSSISVPVDYDGDHVCDRVDSDDDGDGVDDIYDMFQFDASEWDDLDLDGIGDNTDLDDDGDGWDDLDEPNCGSSPIDANSFPSDSDMDRICDALDPDDDNDMILDINDDFPLDPAEYEDYDGDGIGNNADEDDDDDGWPDSLELICQTIQLSATSVPEDTDGDGSCDVIDADDDDDGIGDPNDAFPKNPDEWEDRNGDGLGDRANPLSIVDHIRLNPAITIILLIAILGVTAAVIVLKNRRNQSYSAEVWQDDEYSSYDETPAAPSSPTEYSTPPEIPPMSLETAPEIEPDQIDETLILSPTEKSPPPPPPGFEYLAMPEDSLIRADSWEDLPDGGDYVQTEPMRYVGEDCGTWIRQEDDSWILDE